MNQHPLRDLAEKYRQVLESILTFGEDELVEGLKVPLLASYPLPCYLASLLPSTCSCSIFLILLKILLSLYHLP